MLIMRKHPIYHFDLPLKNEFRKINILEFQDHLKKLKDSDYFYIYLHDDYTHPPIQRCFGGFMGHTIKRFIEIKNNSIISSMFYIKPEFRKNLNFEDYVFRLNNFNQICLMHIDNDIYNNPMQVKWKEYYG